MRLIFCGKSQMVSATKSGLREDYHYPARNGTRTDKGNMRQGGCARRANLGGHWVWPQGKGGNQHSDAPSLLIKSASDVFYIDFSVTTPTSYSSTILGSKLHTILLYDFEAKQVL